MGISEKKMQIVINNYFKQECDVNTSIREAFEKGFRIGVKKASSAQPERSSEIQDILEYLNTVLHPIISPDHWNVYSELHDMISMLPSAQPEQRSFSCGQENDLISRQAAIDTLETVGYDFSNSELSETELAEVCEAVGDVRQDMINRISRMPSAQPEPCEDAVNKIRTASFVGSDGLDYVETLVALEALKLTNRSSAQPEIKPIDYQDCANAMLRMWMDKVVTDGEYNRIMDKLNAFWRTSDGYRR